MIADALRDRVAAWLADFHGEVNDSQVLPPSGYEAAAADLLAVLDGTYSRPAGTPESVPSGGKGQPGERP